ncbi:shikimate kinase [Propionivibrio soli]|uniref:shikimate kinase n=1 Tax=Propionivibrio soli TaxID=2976531 RepID=UPI0030841755
MDNVDKHHNLGNVYLVGLMGAGKTTVGRLLAKKLGREFVDSDREIEARTGVTIPTIFEIEGEDGFRKREAQVIADLAQSSGKIIATGGGAVLRVENRANLKASGFVVYLNVPPHTLLERTRHDRNRPLLQVADPLQKLKDLFLQRDPFYREVADLIIDGGRVSAQGILQLLTKELGEFWTR